MCKVQVVNTSKKRFISIKIVKTYINTNPDLQVRRSPVNKEEYSDRSSIRKSYDMKSQDSTK